MRMLPAPIALLKRYQFAILVWACFLCGLPFWASGALAESGREASKDTEQNEVSTSVSHSVREAQIETKNLPENSVLEKSESVVDQSLSQAKSWFDSGVASLRVTRSKVFSLADDTYASMEVQVQGHQNLTTEEIRSLVPNQKSYYWWRSHKDDVVARVKQHPLVKTARMSACPPNSPLRCLAIEIGERLPHLWVKAAWAEGQEMRFLIADDGAVLAVLRADQQIQAASQFDRSVFARFSAQTLTRLPVLDALELENVSDASKQLFMRAVDLVSVIQEESGSTVYELRFLGSREVEVEFASQPFKVIFNIEDRPSLRARIAAQLLRLDKILETNPLVATRALSINLGLEREAFAVLASNSLKVKAGRI